MLISSQTNAGLPGPLVTQNKWLDHLACAGDEAFEFLTYQLPMVGYWPPLALTGNGELGFDSGDGA